MKRIAHAQVYGKVVGWLIRCPGCQSIHFLDRDIYAFNGDYENPSFSPDAYAGYDLLVCNFAVADGNMHYTAKCTHKLANTAVPLPAWG